MMYDTTQISVWEKESFYAPREVIIAGSGFAGLWCAYYLKRADPKLPVAIVDRGIIPVGASTRNAGFACFGSMTELMADTLQMGEDKMLELVEARYKGLKRIRKTFSHKETGYYEDGGYELITDGQEMDINVLRSNIDKVNHKLKKITGEGKTFMLSDHKIGRFGFAAVRHLVENRLEGKLHPGKLCQALLRLVQSMGVTILNGMEITGFEKVNDRIELHTDRGIDLSARQLLVCTNAFAKQLLPELDTAPARGQILVTSPIADLPFRGSFHSDEGFYYFRDLDRRVLLGGARNKAFEQEQTNEFSTTALIQQELEQFLRKHILPGASFTIDHRWSGIMGMGSEKAPLVKQVSEHIFCAVRFGGMGIALAPTVGERVAEMMRG